MSTSMRRYGATPGRARGAAAVVGGVLVVMSVSTAPLAFYLEYVHEGRFGFRTHGMGTWLIDWFVTHLVVWLVGAALAAAVYVAIRRAASWWPFLVGLGGTGFVVIAVFAAPMIIEPLQYSFGPLEDEEVQLAVSEVIESAEVDIQQILVADASQHTSRHSAYVSGLGASQRLVIYDTLVRDRHPDVVAMVVAHELAHVNHRDVLRNTVLAGVAIVVTAQALAVVLRWRVSRGAQKRASDPHAAAVLLAVVMLAVVIMQPAYMAHSRHIERAADHASLEYTQRPDTYLRLYTGHAEHNLNVYEPQTWERWQWGSHPTTRERLSMGVAWQDDAATTH